MNDRDDVTAALAMLAAALCRQYGVSPVEVRVYVGERPGRPAFVLPFPRPPWDDARPAKA